MKTSLDRPTLKVTSHLKSQGFHRIEQARVVCSMQLESVLLVLSVLHPPPAENLFVLVAALQSIYYRNRETAKVICQLIRCMCDSCWGGQRPDLTLEEFRICKQKLREEGDLRDHPVLCLHSISSSKGTCSELQSQLTADLRLKPKLIFCLLN